MRQRKIREAELERKRKEAEEKRRKEQQEAAKAEMLKKAMFTRGRLVHGEDDED